MITVGITADFTDMDRVMGRLMSAMDEGRINRVASKIAEAQIRKGYKERWMGLTSSTTRWQSRKKFMSKGVGVGFLTGTTYDSITASYDEHMGRVFLAGRWPQGSGRLASPWGHFIEWDSSGLRVKSNPYGDVREYPSENLATKEYGKWRKEGPISWLYLDENNIQVINDAISTSLDVAVGDAKKGAAAKPEFQSFYEEATELKGAHRGGGGALETTTAEYHKEGFQIRGGRADTSIGGDVSAASVKALSSSVRNLTDDAIRAYERELLSRGTKEAVRSIDWTIDDVEIVSKHKEGSVGADIGDAADLWLKQHGGKRK